MGLPIASLAVATNSNDILARFWKSGKYEKVDSEGSETAHSKDASGVKETLSPAMDILISSNFERLLWYLAYANVKEGSVGERQAAASKTLDSWMSKMKSDGRVQVPVEVLESAKRDFVAERISDDLVRPVYVSFAAAELLKFS